jgi:uncharacterized protein YecE (DUF72 family)
MEHRPPLLIFKVMPVIIGASGWQYRDWRDAFYPRGVPQKSWLEFYAQRFTCVEINNSFYMLPKEETFASWRERTPDDLHFVVKASRFITHIKRLKDTQESVRRFMEHARHLGDKLGPILLQLPPNLHKDADNLERTISHFGDEKLTVEFRHDSWYDDEISELLKSHDIPLTLADREESPIQPWWKTSKWGYIRFHHGMREPWPCYTRDGLRMWVDKIGEFWGKRGTVYVFFNNDPKCCALDDAITFAEECHKAGLNPTRVPQRQEVTVEGWLGPGRKPTGKLFDP